MRYPFDDPNIRQLLREAQRFRELRESVGFNNRDLQFILDNRRIFDSLTFQDSLLNDNVAQIARDRLLSINSNTASSLFDASKAANLSAVQMLETVRPRTELAAQLEHISKGWIDQLQLIRETIPDATIDMALKSHLSRISDLSILAQSALANLPLEIIGSKLPVRDDYKSALRDKYLDYSNAYSDLFRSLEQSQTDILWLRPSLTELPAFGYYTGARLVRSVSTEAPTTDDEEISEEIATVTSGALEDRLNDLDPRFVQMLEGARQALHSGNPDYVRQFSISLSELVSHVLKHLVADEKVRAWSEASEYYDESSTPTIAGRLEYLSQKTGHKKLTTCAKKSFAFDLELLNFLQHGSNEAGIDYTPEQLRDLVTKVENTLLLITEIADSQDDQDTDQLTSPQEAAASEQTVLQQSKQVEMVHVLFMDVVGYSKLKTDEQPQILDKLRDIVRSTTEYQRAREVDQMIPLPTGDGMALVFFSNPEAAAKCAIEVSRALQSLPEIELRMGIHTGPAYRILDISGRENVSGGGINFAQRVMDCGDAGHILLSKIVADVLSELSAWANHLHDLGEAEVKHGVRLHLYNLYTDDLGNSAVPAKLQIAADESRTIEDEV